MAYQKVLIHGETEGQVDEDGRYLDVKTDAGTIVLHCEDDEAWLETRIEVAEALALIRSLTEAIEDLQ